jgi:Zn-dependent oligopeptidase
MKQQTIKSLLRTLKQIEKERKARTADLEEAAKVVLKSLADFGRAGIKAASPNQKPTVKKAAKRKRVRRKFGVSGEQSILNFVKSKSNPVGNEIEKHWSSEGRAGTAANLMSKLVKAKRLKRTRLKDERDSRYSLA